MKPRFPTLIFLMMVLTITAILLTSCSGLAMLTSGGSLVITHNTYAKMYNTIDLFTIMSTEKSIKEHAYEKGKYIYFLEKQ